MKPYEPDTLPLDKIDWTGLVPFLGTAHASLARYDGMLQSMVNPQILLSPLTTQEAVLSSRIEGTQATMEEVLEFEADPNEAIEPEKRADIQEIINYRQAIREGVEGLKKRPLCLNLLKDLHVILLDSVRGRNKAPGQFRRVQNFIGPMGAGIENATFVPPSPERVNPTMGNWEEYLHFEEKDRLVQLAVAKAQFELIHPFLDGNGRMGRMLVPLFLYEKGLLSQPMFYLSAYFEAHRQEYYSALNSISGSGNWYGWIRFFLDAVNDQAQTNTAKAHEILRLYDKMKETVPHLTHSQYAIQAIDAIFDRPIFQSSEFIKRSSIPKDSALRILKVLKSENIIEEARPHKGRKAAILVFNELIEIAEKNG